MHERGHIIRRAWRPALAVVSAIAGAILGTAAQAFVDSEFRLLASIAGATAVAIVGICTALLAFADHRKESDLALLAKADNLTTLIELKTTQSDEKMSRSAEETRAKLEHLAERFGLQVDFQLISKTNAMATVDEDPIAQAILGSKRELLVLDLISHEGLWPDESMAEQHVDEYLTALEAHVRECSPPLVYKRILQVTDLSAPFARARTASLARHCREMIEIRNEKDYRVSLRVALHRFPYKFMIVDGEVLVIQLQQYSASSGALEIWGEIAIRDPSGTFVEIFRNIWNEIDDSPFTRTVTSSAFDNSPVPPSS